jgi:nucleoside-diphosphate-sugar epimerase
MYLVTGGAGFIGSNIVRELVARGERVRVFDNLTNGLAANLEPVSAEVEFLEGDIRDAGAVVSAMRGVSRVLHLAALGSVPRSIADPVASNAVNVDGTLNVLVAARDAGVERLVYSSSSSVYGNDPTLPKKEEQRVWPISPYATSKLAAENYTRVFSEVYEIETVCLRYFNVFGPLQRPDAAYAAVIPKFMEWAIKGQPLEIYGDGEQARDFTFVENVVHANLLAATVPGVSGQVFNAACGESYSLLDIAAALEEAVGNRLERRHVDGRPGDIRNSMADVTRAREMLGYEVRVPFREGLARTWKVFCERYAEA